MDSEELLAQLADIHLPEPVSFWPPAPGWWILAAIVIAAIIFGAIKLIAAARYRKITDHALAELDKCYQAYAADSESESDKNALQLQFVNRANSVFKRVALYHFDNTEIASLGGSQWVEFMRDSGNGQLLDAQIAHALSVGRFGTDIDVDVENFYAFGRQWISSLYQAKATKPTPATAVNASASEASQ
jgi:hypothetical protein